MLQKFFKQFLEKEISGLQQADCYRQLREVRGASASRICFEGREVINFSSNNYLGLASSSFLKHAAMEAIESLGIGAGASRLISGNFTLHQELEKALAAFKRTESCLLFNCGYMANCGLLSSLADRHDVVFSDRLNHASIIDGVRLSQAQLVRYHHRNMDDLRHLLLSYSQRGNKLFIVTDTIFSMEGDLAPLPEIVALAKEFGAIVMVDEAHATGVMGEHGRGVVELMNLEDEIDIQMGTLSKAFGGFGAYVAGDALLIDYLINKARTFIFTTALPPATLSASIKALSIMENRPDLRDTLLSQAAWFRKKLREVGFNLLKSETQIIPLVAGDNDKAVQFSRELLSAGIYAPAIRPPAVPQGTARLRISLMATHTMADLEESFEQIQKIGEKLHLI